MPKSEPVVSCVGCGASVPHVEGPTHRYMESSPGCWRLYGEVLAREYSDYRYARVHRLTVDAYAVQHPGQPSPQTIRSVALHLMSLCAVLEQGLELAQATRLLQNAPKEPEAFSWLSPPSQKGEITVVDVHGAEDAEEHALLVRSWAESAWSAWRNHHETIRAWLSKVPDWER